MISDVLYEKLHTLINWIAQRAYKMGYADAKQRRPMDLGSVKISRLDVRKIK
mgnify:CR=1 FL=1